MGPIQWPPHLNSSMFLAVFLTAVSGLLLGYDLCVITVALDLLVDAFSLETSWKEELIVSIVMAGAAAGALAGGPVADKIGRKWTVMICGVLFVVGAIVMAIANSYAILLVGRVVLGVAIGASGMAVSVYITEIAHPSLRGSLVAINEVMICLGCLIAIGIDSWLTRYDEGWRYMLGISAIPALLQVIGLMFLPESPRWLILKGRDKQAKKNLFKLRRRKDDSYWKSFPSSGIPKERLGIVEGRRKNDDETESNGGRKENERKFHGKNDVAPLGEGIMAGSNVATASFVKRTPASMESATENADPISAEFFRIKEDIERLQQAWLAACRKTKTRALEDSGKLGLTKESATPSLWQQFYLSWGMKAHRAAVLTAILVAICQNLTFANAMLYYSHDIFLRADVENHLLSSLGVGLAKFIGVCFALILIPRVNRRALLLTGTVGQFLSVITMAVGFFGSVSDNVRSILVILGMISFIFAWDISWAPLMWVCASELLPTEVRGLGMGLAVSLFWLSAVVTNQTLLTLMDTLGNSGGLFVVAGTTILAFALILRYLPETRNKALEEIQLHFRKNHDTELRGYRAKETDDEDEDALSPSTVDVELSSDDPGAGTVGYGSVSLSAQATTSTSTSSH